MQGLSFKQGDLYLEWIYDQELLKQEVLTRLSTTPSSYSRYILTTTLDSNNKPSYSISTADENYGCTVRSFLSAPESQLNDLEIEESIKDSLSYDPRITLISAEYVGNGTISVVYQLSNSQDPNSVVSVLL